MFLNLLGFGFGSASVTVFTRIGGGIFMKSADIGSDLVGKIIVGLDEDSPLNPGMVADNVGDNVGSLAGMSLDVYDSLNSMICAALIISSLSSEILSKTNSFYFPMLIFATGILTSIFISICGFSIFKPISPEGVERNLKWQPVLCAVIMSFVFWGISRECLPELF